MKTISDSKLKYLIDKIKTLNAPSATKLKDKRKFQVDLSQKGVWGEFDGTTNTVMGVNGTLPVENGGTGVTDIDGLKTSLGMLRVYTKKYTGDGAREKTFDFPFSNPIMFIGQPIQKTESNDIITVINGVKQLGLSPYTYSQISGTNDLTHGYASGFYRSITWDKGFIKLRRESTQINWNVQTPDAAERQLTNILNEEGVEYQYMVIGY